MKFILAIFWNPAQRRLRALWRIVLWAVLMGVLAALSQVPLLGISLLASGDLSGLIADLSGSGAQMALSMLAFLLAILASVALAGRFLDRRPFRDFGFHFSPRWWADFGFGLVLGAGLMAFIFLFELAAGWVQVTGFFAEGGASFLGSLAAPLVLYICVGIQEEITTRGYLLHNLAEGLGGLRLSPRAALFTAYAASSILFGFLHAANPYASLVSTANLMLAGLFLGLPFLLTGDLAISIGLHMTWNFFQGNVFGFPVSGTFSGPTFLAIQQGGPLWATGGAFGPEAGALGLLAMALGSLLVVAWLRRRGPVRWQERLAIYRNDE